MDFVMSSIRNMFGKTQEASLQREDKFRQEVHQMVTGNQKDIASYAAQVSHHTDHSAAAPIMQSTRYNKFATNLAPESMASQRTRHRTRGARSLDHHPIQHLWSTLWGNPRRPNPTSMLRSAPIALVQYRKWLPSTVSIVICIFIEDIINLIATSGLAHMWTRTFVIGAKGALMKRTT